MATKSNKKVGLSLAQCRQIRFPQVYGTSSPSESAAPPSSPPSRFFDSVQVTVPGFLYNKFSLRKVRRMVDHPGTSKVGGESGHDSIIRDSLQPMMPRYAAHSKAGATLLVVLAASFSAKLKS